MESHSVGLTHRPTDRCMSSRNTNLTVPDPQAAATRRHPPIAFGRPGNHAFSPASVWIRACTYSCDCEIGVGGLSSPPNTRHPRMRKKNDMFRGEKIVPDLSISWSHGVAGSGSTCLANSWRLDAYASHPLREGST